MTSRTINLDAFAQTGTFTVTETRGRRRDVSLYLLREIATEFPGERAFECEKPSLDDGWPTYHLRLAPGPSLSIDCDCPGGTYGGACRHAHALRLLLERGLLPVPSVEVPA